MKVTIYNQDGKTKGDHDFKIRDDFNDVSPQVVHDAVTAYRAAQRSGTASVKTVAMVAGSGKKPYKQKGTGRARAGLVRSPIWRKGGVAHGPKPRDYSKDLPKHTRKLAFEHALYSRIKDGDVTVVESIDVDKPKTKDFVNILKGLKIEGRTLFITDGISDNLLKASRNVAWVNTVSSESVNIYEVLNCRKIVLTKTALEKLAGRNKA